MNHFYDPVNDQGLDSGIYSGYKSKEWAQNEKLQKKLIYRIAPSTVASLLSISQQEKIEDAADQTDFTWQKAIDLYIDGDLEAAFYTLGHIIHLIEDAAVPDHTRNDAHPPYDDGGSPYENWTHKISLENPDKDLSGRLKNKKPVLFGDLDSYFNEMAEYSNKNFYSRDSIFSYKEPEPADFLYIDKYLYGTINDGDGIYKLIRKELGFLDYVLKKGEYKVDDTFTIDSPLILKDYWHRLSTKAVQHAAGVINLFLKEAEEAKAKYEREKASRPYLSTLIDGFKGLFGGEEDQPVSVIDIARDSEKSFEEDADERDESPALETVEPLSSIGPIGPIIPIKPIGQTAPTNTQDSGSVKEKTDIIPIEIVALQLCSFNGSYNPPTRQGIIINEVAWMGSANSASDEWLELKNISGVELDLSGWQLVDMGEQIKVQLDRKIPAGGFYLLERTDDNSVPGITADKIYKGALSNVGEGLRLFAPKCVLTDEILAAPDWPAGDNIYKKTMERAMNFSWRNSSNSGGTPKAENSEGTEPISYAGGGGGGGGSQSSSQASTPQEENQDQPEEPPASVPENSGASHLVISEILFDAEGSDAGKEFIELYNPTGQFVDLSTWSIQHLASSGSLSKKNFGAGDSIAPKSFFLIWLGSDARADMQWTSGSFNNSGATIYLVDNQDLVSTTTTPVAVDIVGYDIASLSGFVAGQSIERKAHQGGGCISAQGLGEYLGNGCDNDVVSDFELRSVPSPQNAASLPEPRSAPAAVRNFNVVYSSTALELVFTWDSAEENPTSTPRYKIFQVSDDGSVLVGETEETEWIKKISEIGRNYEFEIVELDKDGLVSEAASASVSAPSYFSSLDFYQDPVATTSPKYLLGLDWEEYPFISIQLPHLASGQPLDNSWHAVIFYYNQEAPATGDLWWIDYDPEAVYKSWGLISPGGFKVAYPNCLGDGRETGGASLILPDDESNCSGLQGFYASYALNWPELEDSGLLLAAADENFASSSPVLGQDYVTAAFYAFQPGYEPNNYGLKFLAADKNRYYFQEIDPVGEPPTAPEEIDFEFDQDAFLLRISWEPSTDPDTLDKLITYEISYDDFSTTTADNFLEISVEPGRHYDFELRAKDDLGNTSETISEFYDVPDLPLPYGLTNIGWGISEEEGDVVLNLEFDDYPFSDFENSGAMIFFLNQNPPANYSFLNDDYRNGDQAAGGNSALEISYDTCDFSGTWHEKAKATVLIFKNSECPESASSILMDELLAANIAGGDTEFSVKVKGDFDEDDYITIGFYELGEKDFWSNAYFENVANYNKKIYFKP